MKGQLTKRIVKIKKIQKVGENLMILLPKAWLEEMDWNRSTQLVLEFMPHRKTLILSENDPRLLTQTISPIIIEQDGVCKNCGGEGCKYCDARKLNDEKISDIISVPD